MHARVHIKKKSMEASRKPGKSRQSKQKIVTAWQSPYKKGNMEASNLASNAR